MTEGIRVEADPYFRSQSGLAISLAVEGVANKALGRGNIAVGFDGPTANHLPAALADSLLNLLQHLRIGAFDPTIVGRRGMAVAESGSLVDAVQSAAKCGEHGIRAIAPRP